MAGIRPDNAEDEEKVQTTNSKGAAKVEVVRITGWL